MTLYTGDDIKKYQFLARKCALKLELDGFRPRGASMLTICNKAYGYNATRKAALFILMDKDWEDFKRTGDVKWQRIEL